MNELLSTLIKAKRLEYKLTQQELADTIGVSKSYINKIEHNQSKKPSISVLNKLSKVLNIDFVELAELSDYNIDDISLYSRLMDNILEYKINTDICIRYKNNENKIDIINAIKDYKNNSLEVYEIIYLFVVWMKEEKIDERLLLDFVRSYHKS